MRAAEIGKVAWVWPGLDPRSPNSAIGQRMPRPDRFKVVAMVSSDMAPQPRGKGSQRLVGERQ